MPYITKRQDPDSWDVDEVSYADVLKEYGRVIGVAAEGSRLIVTTTEGRFVLDIDAAMVSPEVLH